MPDAALDPLGTSLRLDDGDLVLEKADGVRDLARVRGRPALAQALELTIETQLGTDPLNPVHGFDFLSLGAGAHTLSTRKEYVRMQLVRAIAGDRRVKAIRELFFDDDDRYFELHPEVDRATHVRAVHASRRLTATVVLEARTGEDLALTVGGLSG